jgi:hypothetical protein
MSELADESLTQLVQNTLPRLGATRMWRVEVVDRVDKAWASRRTATVRVHRSWRETIYGARLQSITRHYPLALKRIPVDDERMRYWRDQRFKLWRAITIEQVYSGGRFTGELSVGRAFVAQTSDGFGTCADEDCVTAAREALSQSRSEQKDRLASERMVASARDGLRDLLFNRANNYSGYGGFLVSLDPYRHVLPAWTTKTLARHDEANVPLYAIEKESAVAVSEMPLENIFHLLYQLDQDVCAARASIVDAYHASLTSDVCGESRDLTSEEATVLADLSR